MAQARSPADGTMTVHVARALLGRAALAGLLAPEVERRLGLPAGALGPEVLGDVDGRIPARLVLALWEGLPALCGDPEHFGLSLARLAAEVGLTAAWWVVQSSATLHEGVERAVRYQRLLHDHSRGELRVTPEGVGYVHRVGDATFRAPRHAIEFGFAGLVHMARRSTGQPVAPSRVLLAHRAPRDLGPYREVFGDAVVFGAASDELWFDRRTAALPSVQPAPALLEVLEAHAAALLSRLPPSDSAASQVRAMLPEVLRSGSPALPALARRLGLAPRALQRRLKAEGTSVQQLVDEVRLALARRLLEGDGALLPHDIAFALGFSDYRAFLRAFVRWTGTTPGRYRRSASTPSHDGRALRGDTTSLPGDGHAASQPPPSEPPTSGSM